MWPNRSSVLAIVGVAGAMALSPAGSQAAFEGRASPVKPPDWVILPGHTPTVGGLMTGMTKQQALDAWGRPSFCARASRSDLGMKSCTWFTKRQRRRLMRGYVEVSKYRERARGDFAHVLFSGGRVKFIMLSAGNGTSEHLTRFKIADTVGLLTSYEAITDLFPEGTCPACPGGPATVRKDALDRRTWVYYLNENGTVRGGGGLEFDRYVSTTDPDKIGFISIRGGGSSGDTPPER
jgi:hypothetical protein